MLCFTKRYASREIGDADVILLQIYWSMYVPVIISVYKGSTKVSTKITWCDFFSSQCSRGSASQSICEAVVASRRVNCKANESI